MCSSSEGLEDGGEVLGVGEESHDVEVVCPHEVEPSAREPVDASDPKPRDVAEFTDAWRAGTGHPLDGLQGGDRRVEEPLGDVVAGLGGVVAGSFDQVGFGQRAKPSRRHDSAFSACSRSSAIRRFVSGPRDPIRARR